MLPVKTMPGFREHNLKGIREIETDEEEKNHAMCSLQIMPDGQVWSDVIRLREQTRNINITKR